MKEIKLDNDLEQVIKGITAPRSTEMLIALMIMEYRKVNKNLEVLLTKFKEK